MPDNICEGCRAVFVGNDGNDSLADLIEERHPSCECERASVGIGSPGVVGNSEILARIIVSPRDIETTTGEIAVRPFQKAFKNGLSVVRSIAIDDDVENLVRDGLSATNETVPRIQAVLVVPAESIRSKTDEADEKVFCIYDQTVARRDKDLSPVPTHAGIFQRLPKKKTENRKNLQKDFALWLYRQFVNGEISMSDFRNGLLLRANENNDLASIEEPPSEPAA